MASPDNRPQNEQELLKERIRSDMRDQGLVNLSDKNINTMADIIFGARHAEIIGDIRGLLGDLTSSPAKIYMQHLPRNDTRISDDINGWAIRSTTARLLAEEAFGNGKHAQSPILITYCFGSIPKPSTRKPFTLGPSL